MSDVKPRARRIHSPRANELEAVVVIWKDAALGFDDDKPENIKGGLVINHTIGWLLRKTRNEVILVIDCTPDPTENTVRWPYTIPRQWVLNIIPLNFKSGDTKWQLDNTESAAYSAKLRA